MTSRNTPSIPAGVYRPCFPENMSSQNQVYYPFSMPFQQYPFGMAYPYTHPHYYNINSQPTTSQIPNFQLPPIPHPKKHETSTIQQGTKKIEVIDLEEMQGKVKLEHIEAGKKQQKRGQKLREKEVEKVKIEETKVRRIEPFNRKNQLYIVQQIAEKRLQNHQTFKKLLLSLVNQDPNRHQIYLECRERLCQRENSSEKRTTYESIYSLLSEKFKHFKKTKEELIKYIIRRTYHHAKPHKDSFQTFQYDRLEQFHQRNLKLHKSMNNEFLKTQFTNKVFLTYFSEFYEKLEEQFEFENNEKIQKFAHIITSAWIVSNLSMIQFQKKLPWLDSYKKRIKNLARDLHRAHSQAPLTEEKLNK